jgi:DNA-directed RNA polymerase specialized sigma24 family protein
VQPEGLAERLKQVAGASGVPELQAFDAQNPLHVDRAAQHLLERLYGDNDGAAFRLLVELVEPLLLPAAQDITREVGLATDPRGLVSAHLARLFVDLRQPMPEVRHFLEASRRAMAEDAARRVEELAAALPLTASEPTLPPGGGATPVPAPHTLGVRFLSLVSACFHGLDAEDRRILIAREVDNTSYADLAEAFGITRDQVATRVMQARSHLAAAIAQAFHALNPVRGDQP